MRDKEDTSAIIDRASGSEPLECKMIDYPDMSRDLPMQNAIDVVNCSTRAAEKKNEKDLRDFKQFTKSLREELLNRSLITKKDDRPTSLKFFDIVPTYAKETFSYLRDEIPSYRLLRDQLKALVERICTTMQRTVSYSEDDYSDLADALMSYVWPNPIQPYVTNLLLRETAIKSVDLVELWHSAVESEDLTKEEAVEQLEYCAEKANQVSKLFTDDNTVYFCENIEQNNDLSVLQKVWHEERGDTVSSWEKKHGAFVKASLMYAIHMIDGTICRKETNMVMKEIRRRIGDICVDLGGDAVLVNPTEDGKIGPNSLILNKIDFNSKDPESEYLKFITKLLNDDVAPHAHTTSDRHRFRGYLLEDPRNSHPHYKNVPVEVAEIASATKFLAIVMMRFGTTVDKRNVRNSINTGYGINEKSGRIHRALQWKGSVFVDRHADGGLREKSKSYMYECQALCHVPEGSYEADVAEYRRKKILKAQKVLGVGINFAADTLNLCDVFVNRYAFPHDAPEMRELAEITFGAKMQKVPFMKEMVAKKIIDRLTTNNQQTQEIIVELLQRRSAGKKITQALEEIEIYLNKLKAHYLNRKSYYLCCRYGEKIKDDALVRKIYSLHKMLSGSQVVELTDIFARISDLQEEFEDYASIHQLLEYNQEQYSAIRGLLEEIYFIAHKGPSGLLAKLQTIKDSYLAPPEPDVEETEVSKHDQLSLFEE